MSADYLPVLDPCDTRSSQVPLTVRDPKTPRAARRRCLQPSPYWGDEAIWTSRNNVHNPMFDGQGRVWMTSRDPAAGQRRRSAGRDRAIRRRSCSR